MGPKFNKRGPIEMLLGMDVIFEIMKSGLIRGKLGQLMAQETQIGWIMSGKIDPQYPKNDVKCLVATVGEGIIDLSRFWEMEELNPERALTNNEQECEKFYQENVKQDIDGKYIVKIPFKGNTYPTNLGSS